MRRPVGVKLGFGFSFLKNTEVIDPFIVAGESAEYTFRLGVTIARSAGKLVCYCEAQQPQRVLIVRLLRKDVAANRLSLTRLIQVAIDFDFGNCFRNSSS